MNISVIIMTHDSEVTIPATLAAARQVSDDVHIVDSYSSDSTLRILDQSKVHWVQHPFENYAAQRNWAIDTLALKYEWELHLDADERLTPALIEEINRLQQGFPSDINGYYLPRLVYFLQRPLYHGGMYPIWHMRLFRHGKGRCENRLYDAHFYAEGLTGKLKSPMIDDNRMNLTEWVNRHNAWADAEVEVLVKGEKIDGIEPKPFGNPVQRKRYLKGGYYRCPFFLRAFLLFLYRYVVRLGFLDGIPGLIFYALQSFWFRFLIDAKYYERKMAK
jgi:glycosyltransferase involved in cell wall biosynthesis